MLTIVPILLTVVCHTQSRGSRLDITETVQNLDWLSVARMRTLEQVGLDAKVGFGTEENGG